MENKQKHLDFIQETINRMAKNSFMLKGWTITLVSSIFVLISRNIVQWYYYLVVMIPTFIFWGLDSYYLQIEREYRTLYDKVRHIDEDDIDFSMKTEHVKNGWLRSILSKTEIAFYCVTIFISIVVTLLIVCL